MYKQCKNCNAQMPEEANICLECLTLCEEKETKKSTLSKDSNKKTNMLFSCLLYTIVIIAVCFAVSELNAKRGEIKPANADLTAYYDDNSTNNSNKNESSSQNNNTENYLNNSNTPVNTQQSVVSQSKDNTTTENKSTKSLSTNSSVVQNIKINPTTKPSNTLDSPNNSSSNHTTATKKETTTSKPNSNQQTTKKPASNNTTESNTTKPAGAEPEYDKFEHYLDNDGRLHISKYTGSSKNVIVPDTINNINVYRIDAETFKDNSHIETITFKDSVSYHTLWIVTHAIYNCSALKKIVFPRNTDLGILSQFARNCPKLNNIDIDNWQYEFVNGGLYYYNTNAWSLYYYCEGYPSTEFRPPSFFRGTIQASLFDYCRNVKSIYLNEATTISGFYSISSSNNYIEGVYADKNNQKQFDVDGVVFDYPTSSNPYIKLNYYPKNKKDKSFKVPENARFDEIYNPYIEELILPKSVFFYSDSDIKAICMKQKTKNLKTIRVQKGSPYTERIKSTFTGTVIEY